jgi:acetyl esterase/lipase
VDLGAAKHEPVIYRYGGDPAQFGELWLPEGAAAGTVVVIHGGFWRARYDLSLGRPLAADLAARGYAAWNLEYRRALAGGGWPETFEDVAAGIDLLATLPVDTSRVVAVGHSAGGHLSAWAAGRAKLPPGAPGAPAGGDPGRAGGSRRAFVAVTGVVSQAGVLALADCARERVGGTAALDLMGAGPDELQAEYRLADPIAAVPLDAPVLCLHSRGDADVPYSYSERYVAAATAAGGRATLTETHGDHFTLIDPASADWAAAIAALPALHSLAGRRGEASGEEFKHVVQYVLRYLAARGPVGPAHADEVPDTRVGVRDDLGVVAGVYIACDLGHPHTARVAPGQVLVVLTEQGGCHEFRLAHDPVHPRALRHHLEVDAKALAFPRALAVIGLREGRLHRHPQVRVDRPDHGGEDLLLRPEVSVEAPGRYPRPRADVRDRCRAVTALAEELLRGRQQALCRRPLVCCHAEFAVQGQGTGTPLAGACTSVPV